MLNECLFSHKLHVFCIININLFYCHKTTTVSGTRYTT